MSILLFLITSGRIYPYPRLKGMDLYGGRIGISTGNGFPW